MSLAASDSMDSLGGGDAPSLGVYHARDLVLTKFDMAPGGEVPSARCGHQLVTLDADTLLLFGGADEDRILADAFVFRVGAQQWEKAQMTGFSTPGPLFGHSMCAPGGDASQLFLFGGLTLASTYSFEADDGGDAGPQSVSGMASLGLDSDYSGPRRKLFKAKDEEATNALYTFDKATMQWAEPLVKGAPPSPRYMHSACFVGGLMVVFGGCQESGYRESTNDVFVFDTETSAWTQPEVSGVRPAPRHGHSAIHLGDSRMLVFGGANEDGPVVERLNDVYVLDVATWEWSRAQVKGSPPVPRAFHSCGVVEHGSRLMFVVGGETAQGHSDVCVMNLESLRWKRPLFEGSFRQAMCGASVVGDKVLVCGGLAHAAGAKDKALLAESFLLNLVAIRPSAQNDFTFKVILAGNAGVGKSCLMTRFVEDQFSDFHVSTIGVDFKTMTTMVQGKVIKQQIWDSAGQERFAQVTSHYYRGADGAILVYDVTDMASFEGVLKWVEAIENANTHGKSVLKLLVGNKADMQGSRQVTTEQGEELARQLDAPFVETSAKTSVNVDCAFLDLARLLVEKQNASRGGGGRGNGKANVRLADVAKARRGKKCC